ncbi:Pyruvate kinase cytosolic isozyme [Nymphaea thermarum]|nr:Pyruvate kinase cytosolic isozyme [Nymphaea thermarum]
MMKSAPLPMSPLESLASSALRTATEGRATLIIVLTRGGTTAKLRAVPILSVVVPILTTDSFDWTCSDESPARHSLLLPRERKMQEFQDAVVDRYEYLPEIKRINRHRHLPKPVYKEADNHRR